MTQINFYKNGTGEYIKDWPNWSGVVPAVGDIVTLHYGDNNEDERPYIVRLRVIDGTRPDRIRLFIEEQPKPDNYISDEEAEDLLQQMRRMELNRQHPILARPLTECNLSVRTLNICKANDMNTVADIARIQKTDWMKYRNGGKKSLMELDELLTDNGLTWGMDV